MTDLDTVPPDPVSGPRPTSCKKGHDPEHSVRRWSPSGSRWRWVCQECDRVREHERQRTPDALQRRRDQSAQHKRRSRELTRMKGYPVPWLPGLGHCETDNDNPDWSRKPSRDTEYLLATCNGRKGLPACPVRDQCLVWAKDQPMFVGTAGGQAFGLADREESAA